MQKKLLTLAILTAVAGSASAAQGSLTAVQSMLSATPAAGSIVINFTGLTFPGFNFLQVAGDLAGPVYGTLTSVSVNATLNASTSYTYADDLTIYVDALPLSTGGLLQVGGFSNLSAAERHSWANGASSAPGTTVIDTVALATPLTFNGTAADPVIWLGNGYGASGTSGTWTGSITLTGLSVTPVPEPASWALLGAGAIGLMGWVGRRRRTADTV